MRKILVAAVGAAIAVTGVVGLATPASAYCDPTFYELTGRCNACYLVAPTYHKVTGQYMDCLS